jgi:hypothetical protein
LKPTSTAEIPADLDALTSKRTHMPVVVAEGAAEYIRLAHDPQVVTDRELASQVREGGWIVVGCRTVNATLRRALLKHPPRLLIVTGDADAETLETLRGTGMRVLGPGARLEIDGWQPGQEGGPGRLACAPNEIELHALVRASGSLQLVLCPTPSWLPIWLEHGLSAMGSVDSRVLDSAWAGMASSSAPEHVLVPLGAPSIDLDEIERLARGPDLDRATLAQALERRTGAIFPSPRVIELVHRIANRDEGSRATADPAAPDDPQARAVWRQAQRALPQLGHRIGMTEPAPGIPLDVPAAAFLAQRALLRLQRARMLSEQTLETPERPDAATRTRADEVLRASAEALSEHESKVVLRGYGFEITRQAVATSASGAASFAERIGFPVVLKAVSPDLRRKQELGLVRLDLPTAAAVRRAHAQIHERAEREAPTARIDGVIVAEMVEAGLELRCGVVRTASERTIVYVQPQGPGLAPVEPLLAYAPLSPVEAMTMADLALEGMPSPALRRATDPKAEDLAEVLLRLSALHDTHGERLRAVELSPVRLVRSERRHVVLDARIIQRPHLEGV